jgi:formylglycine-generating enzyme required for sulfatase activity
MMWNRTGWACATVVTLLLTLATEARGEHRVALVIGNANYTAGPLASPESDAEAAAEALRSLGFRTIVERDLDREGLRRAVDRLVASAPTRGTALVYFAGYALAGEKNGHRDTYLLPIGEDVRSDRDIGNRGIGANELLATLSKDASSVNHLVLVDGCYEWPKELQNVPAGPLVPTELPAGSLLCFATGPGAVAVPGDGPSPLAASLAETVRQRIANPDGFFGDLTDRVARRTGGGQQIWWQSTLADDVSLLAEAASQAVASPEELTSGSRAGDEWVDGRGMVFCWCPPGTFAMGSAQDMPGRQPDEGPVEVTLSRGFWMAKHELTRGQSTRLNGKSFGTEKNHPLESLHLDDFRTVIRTINQDERKAKRLPEDWEYALPTEAQWEWACRAGSDTRFSFGNDERQLTVHGNFADRSLFETQVDFFHYARRDLNDGVAWLAPVGSYAPNAWGLHDMHGNVWEFTETKYSKEPEGGRDPVGPKDGALVIRGGAWTSVPDSCRAAFRHHASNRAEEQFLGFRLILRQTP